MRRFLFAFVLLLCLSLLYAGAEDAVCGEYTYTVDENGAAVITGYTGEAAILEIPESLDGHTVSTIGEWAFFDCKAETITVPDTVTELRDCAFAKCPELKEIVLPVGLETIGTNPFNMSEKLTGISISYENSRFFLMNGVLFDSADMRLVYYPISSAASRYSIPEGTIIIEEYAFHGCANLTEIIIPGSVTTIGDLAFMDCGSLTSITVPEGVTSLGDCTFAFCENLASVSLPGSLTEIGGDPFLGCENVIVYAPEGSFAEKYLLENGAVMIGKTSEQTSDAAVSQDMTGTWIGRNEALGITLTIQLREDGTGSFRFEQHGFVDAQDVIYTFDDNGKWSASVPDQTGTITAASGGSYDFDGRILHIEVITELTSGGTYMYEVDCTRQ